MRMCGKAQLLRWSQLVDHKSPPLVFQSNWSIKGLLRGTNLSSYCASLLVIVIISKSQWLFVLGFSPCYNPSPMFQDPMDKFHLNLKTCPWKPHNQHWVKCTQNNPFIDLGKLRVNLVWHGSFQHALVYHVGPTVQMACTPSSCGLGGCVYGFGSPIL